MRGNIAPHSASEVSCKPSVFDACVTEIGQNIRLEIPSFFTQRNGCKRNVASTRQSIASHDRAKLKLLKKFPTSAFSSSSVANIWSLKKLVPPVRVARLQRVPRRYHEKTWHPINSGLFCIHFLIDLLTLLLPLHSFSSPARFRPSNMPKPSAFSTKCIKEIMFLPNSSLSRKLACLQ